MLKAYVHLCQHLQINSKSTCMLWARIAKQTKQTDVHTHTFWITKGLASVCADHLWGCTHIHKPPFLLPLFSIILLRVQRWGLYFQTKHRLNSANPTPTPPSITPRSPSLPYSPLPSLCPSLSFFLVCVWGRNELLASVKIKRPDKAREWTVSREGEEKWILKKRCLGKKRNYDCKEGSSAMADDGRIESKMRTTIERLLAYFSSSVIALFSYGFFDDVDPVHWCQPQQTFSSGCNNKYFAHLLSDNYILKQYINHLSHKM